MTTPGAILSTAMALAALLNVSANCTRFWSPDMIVHTGRGGST